MYYSIFDLETQQYLHSGRNSKTKREAYLDYLEYRWPDLEEIVCETFHISDEEMNNLTIEDIMAHHLNAHWIQDDMTMCCFELREHKLPIQEDF